jgi:hypothetical protein
LSAQKSTISNIATSSSKNRRRSILHLPKFKSPLLHPERYATATPISAIATTSFSSRNNNGSNSSDSNTPQRSHSSSISFPVTPSHMSASFTSSNTPHLSVLPSSHSFSTDSMASSPILSTAAQRLAELQARSKQKITPKLSPAHNFTQATSSHTVMSHGTVHNDDHLSNYSIAHTSNLENIAPVQTFSSSSSNSHNLDLVESAEKFSFEATSTSPTSPVRTSSSSSPFDSPKHSFVSDRKSRRHTKLR